MKLKCEMHGRRVVAVSSSPILLHRTGDMSECTGQYALLIDNTLHTVRRYKSVVDVEGVLPDQGFKLVEVQCRKEARPNYYPTTHRRKG